MKRLLALLLFSGVLALPQCNPCRCPEVTDTFFDITDLEVGHIAANGNFLSMEEPIERSEYGGIALSFETEYIAHSNPMTWFSSSAFACSCPDPGWDGSKHEAFVNIIITTLVDMDTTFNAGDTVTQLFSIDWDLDTLSIPAFLAKDTGKVQYERYNLILSERPGPDVEELNFQVRVELSTGEAYTDQTGSIFFRP